MNFKVYSTVIVRIVKEPSSHHHSQFLKIYLLMMCLAVLPACISVCYMCEAPNSSFKGYNGITSGCEPSCGG